MVPLFSAKVHDMIASCLMEEGMSMTELRQRLRGVSEANLR